LTGGNGMQLGSAVRLLQKGLGCLLAIIWLSGIAYGAAPNVPEIDAGLTGGSVALIVGSYLVLASRMRRKE
jgi:hypothetical protein